MANTSHQFRALQNQFRIRKAVLWFLRLISQLTKTIERHVVKNLLWNFVVKCIVFSSIISFCTLPSF
jgi:hypothetical protein